MNQRRIPFLLIAMALLLHACASTLPRAEQDIRALEQRQVQAAIAGDRAALEGIFAPEFRLINPSGAVASRDELLNMLGGGSPPYRAATYTTDTVRVHRDVVVTTGRENVEFAANGQRQQRRVTHVWERRGDGWQLVLRHATLIAAP